LLQNSLHEAHFVALVLLAEKFKANPEKTIHICLGNIRFINNWDLVDVSAHKICGAYCLKNDDMDIIWQLAKSDNLWENRIAVVSSFVFIKDGKGQLTIDLCKHFLDHRHHLTHNACGWMLREVGKRVRSLLLNFANSHKPPGIMKSSASEIVRKNAKGFWEYFLDAIPRVDNHFVSL
jgi:3-methyladenine DNA glycosylase AlkD